MNNIKCGILPMNPNLITIPPTPPFEYLLDNNDNILFDNRGDGLIDNGD